MKMSYECDRTRELLDELSGRVRLLDIEKSVRSPDFAGTSDTGKRKDKTKKGRIIDSLVGKMGFTLLLVPEANDLNDRKCAGEYGMKENINATDSPDSSISEAHSPSTSLNNVSVCPELQTISAFPSTEEILSNEDVQ